MSLGIEAGAERARAGRSCPAEHISVAVTTDKISKGRNANKPVKKDEGCISWYILHLFRYSFLLMFAYAGTHPSAFSHPRGHSTSTAAETTEHSPAKPNRPWSMYDFEALHWSWYTILLLWHWHGHAQDSRWESRWWQIFPHPYKTWRPSWIQSHRTGYSIFSLHPQAVLYQPTFLWGQTADEYTKTADRTRPL